jgi:hypothetical protein
VEFNHRAHLMVAYLYLRRHSLEEATRRMCAGVKAFGPEADAEAFFAAHPHLLSKVLLRLWYSRERMMSAEAKAGWVEPDLAPLPAVTV